MNRRSIFAGLATALPSLLVGQAMAGQTCVNTPKRDSVTWKVPDGIKRVRVRSWGVDGNEVIDTQFGVKPGQEFRIDVVRGR
jgi:hypothetical protein